MSELACYKKMRLSLAAAEAVHGRIDSAHIGNHIKEPGGEEETAEICHGDIAGQHEHFLGEVTR